MNTKIFLTAVALILTMPAAAEFIAVENGYEVGFDEIRLPQSEGGTIAYKPCESCDYVTNRIAPDVRWQINARAVTLAQFRERMAAVEGRSHAVTITQNIESQQVTKVSTAIRDSE